MKNNKIQEQNDMILKPERYPIILFLCMFSVSFSMYDPNKKPFKFTATSETSTNNSHNAQNPNSVKKDPNTHNTSNSTTASSKPEEETQKQDGSPSTSSKPPAAWLVRSSLNNAPPLLKGILSYLKKYNKDTLVPSFHRMIFVGEPGTGKTTLAIAMALELKCEAVLVPATSFLGTYRHEAVVRMRELFNNIIEKGPSKKIVIIDELHKLFERHADEKSDNAENAAAFWLMLDMLEKKHPNIIVIGTANSVAKLPPEIKSRFHGKLITIPLPSKNQKLQAFKDIIKNDATILLDDSIDEQFIQRMSQRLEKCSLRDIQLLVDTAKMFKYADNGTNIGFLILLEKKHFEQAFNQLNTETEDGKKSLYETALPVLKEVSFCLSLFLNATHLTYILSTVNK